MQEKGNLRNVDDETFNNLRDFEITAVLASEVGRKRKRLIMITSPWKGVTLYKIALKDEEGNEEEDVVTPNLRYAINRFNSV